MTPSDIVDRVKRQFGDESGVQITDNDILRWINDAQRDIVVKHNLLQTRATAETVVGQKDYSMPLDILNLIALEYAGKRLKNLQIQDAGLIGLEASEQTGTPTEYTFFAGVVTVHPTPDVVGVLSMLFTRTPAPVASLTDVLGLPLSYHNLVVQYCLTQAYELDENFQASEIKSRQYSDNMSELKDSREDDPDEFYPHITYIGRGDYSYVDGTDW